MHLSMHAQTFGTLNNTQVRIKEMVHRIFKGIVPNTNHKDIDLDLIKRYNTLFAIRHLSDGGIDPRFTRPCASFTSLGYLLSDWYLTEDKSSNEEQISNDDDGDVLKEFYFNFLICICSSINFFKKFSYITSRIYFQYIFKKRNVQEKSG